MFVYTYMCVALNSSSSLSIALGALNSSLWLLTALRAAPLYPTLTSQLPRPCKQGTVARAPPRLGRATEEPLGAI